MQHRLWNQVQESMQNRARSEMWNHVRPYMLYFNMEAQYGHSQSEKKLGVGDKYDRSIKVHS